MKKRNSYSSEHQLFLPTYVSTIYNQTHASLLNKKWLLAKYVRIKIQPLAQIHTLYTG